MSTPDHVLVVGGTGPTGVPLVQGLVDRGHRVTILHRGTHEDPETPTEVEHLHADPYDADSLQDALGDRRFELSIVMYGRLRTIAEELGWLLAYSPYHRALDPAAYPAVLFTTFVVIRCM